LLTRLYHGAPGRALSVGLIALPYYHITNPVLAAISRRAIDEVIADFAARNMHGADPRGFGESVRAVHFTFQRALADAWLEYTLSLPMLFTAVTT
jgi:hypothetical protein